MTNPDLTLPQVAAKRGWQTMAVAVIGVMGLSVVEATVTGQLAPIDSWADLAATWPEWTWELSKAAVTGGLAWVWRRFGDQSGFEPPTEARRALGV